MSRIERSGSITRPQLAWLVLLALSACSVGEGEGEVTSERLRIPGCWDGPFDLAPTFFSADPYRDTVTIRLQRGQQFEDVSDGVFITVNDGQDVRENKLGQRLPLNLPPGVSPPGVPQQLSTVPHEASLALYLHDTCHTQNAAMYAIDGWVQFESLFSGNLNEDDAADRLTEGSFEAVIADPRSATPIGSGSSVELQYAPEDTSVLSGTFKFFFHRGRPAQPFP